LFLTVKNTVGHGRFYGATDGDLRWNFTVTVTVRWAKRRAAVKAALLFVDRD